MMFKLFQKKLRGELEKAFDEGLITKEEMLRLKVERATKELNKLIEKDEGGKTKKRK